MLSKMAVFDTHIFPISRRNGLIILLLEAF